MLIETLFYVHVARSKAFTKYNKGTTAFVSNGFRNNGVLGYIAPLAGDKVFKKQSICISAFCEATVQDPSFMGRGNGGSGMIVNKEILLFYAAFINKYVKWRFSFGRMVSKARIPKIILPSLESVDIKNLSELMPQRNKTTGTKLHLSWRSFNISELFDPKSGEYHNAGALPFGDIPLVSCGEKNDGVAKFVSVPNEHTYKDVLTIAFNGQPLTTKYRPYKFAAKDDVAVCVNKENFGREVLLFIKMMIEKEMWRYSFGRKCFLEKLLTVNIQLPINNDNEIDKEKIKTIIANTSYWNFLNKSFNGGMQMSRDIA
jgi:hypothetical protein